LRKKLDFVTNSSSTSFVILCKKVLTAEEFINHMWDSGLGDRIKKELIKTMCDRVFPLKVGVNDLSVYSDNYDSLFSQFLYNFPDLWWNNKFEGNYFCMKEGDSGLFIDERNCDDESFLQGFPEEYHQMIEDYIEANK